MLNTPRDGGIAAPPRPVGGRGGPHRPDIDGLRAVAVSLVVLFHYGVAALPGGFVGVDVFFVISGYLITAITRGELGSGRFSLAGFYERRLRRIVPALAAVLLATGIASLFVVLPEDLRLLARSTEASALFGSSILFSAPRRRLFRRRQSHPAAPAATPGRWPSKGSSTCSSRWC